MVILCGAVAAVVVAALVVLVALLFLAAMAAPEEPRARPRLVAFLAVVAALLLVR